jgi:predicted ferric reductase
LVNDFILSLQVFLALPCLLFIVQFVHKAFSRLHQRSHIIESQILPGGVTRIVFPRPKSMGACKAGQYVEITIHAISHVEVHPFSLSGCPGDGMLQLHIKDLGDWTHRLYELASENRLNGQTIYVMGPFVTRAYEFMKYSNILLVGGGIGATPFVSIIENILKTDQSKKKRVHFHWLVNDQQAAKSWFPGLLQAVEDYSGDQQIMASVWYTGGRVFSSSIEKRLFEFSEKILWDENGRDFVMGIQKKNHRVKVNFGRPTWDDVLFEQTSGADEEPIGVFCCGPDGLTNSLEIACMEQSTLKQPINFHAEHFNSW